MLYVRKLGLRETTSRPLGRIGIGGGIATYVGTDPVSVRHPCLSDIPFTCPTPIPVRSIRRITFLRSYSPRIFIPSLSVGCGQTRGLSLHAGGTPELASIEFRGAEKQNPRNLTLQDGCGDSYTNSGLLYLRRPKVLIIAR